MKKTINIHEQASWKGYEAKMSDRMYDFVKDEIRFVQKLRDFFGSNFGGIPNIMIRGLGTANLYGTPNYTYNYLYYANQLNLAWFRYVMNDGKAVTLQIADKAIETVGQFKNESIGARNVMNGIVMALLLRDKKALDFYAQIPLSFTMQGNQEDLIWESMLLFYQVLIKGTGNEHEAHGAYYEITKLLDWDEYKRTITQKDNFLTMDVWQMLHKWRSLMAQHITLPVLAIYHCILHKDQAAFEEAVYQALLKWKEYYTMQYVDEQGEERDHSIEPQGYLALPIAAACAYAHDKGIKLETVESDYIPKWMIEGRFEDFELLVKGS